MFFCGGHTEYWIRAHHWKQLIFHFPANADKQNWLQRYKQELCYAHWHELGLIKLWMCLASAQNLIEKKKKASFLTFLIKNVNVCFQCNRHLLSNQISHTEAFIRTRFTPTQNRKPMNNFCIVFETSWGSESVCLSLSVCKRHLKGVSASTTGSGVAVAKCQLSEVQRLVFTQSHKRLPKLHARFFSFYLSPTVFMYMCISFSSYRTQIVTFAPTLQFFCNIFFLCGVMLHVVADV